MPTLDEQLRAMMSEAHGCFTLKTFRPLDAADLVLRGLTDKRALLFLRAIVRAVAEPQPECLGCAAPIDTETVEAVTIIWPDVPNPKAGIGGGICAGCAAEADSAIATKIAGFMRAAAWPSLRVIPAANLFCDGGRA